MYDASLRPRARAGAPPGSVHAEALDDDTGFVPIKHPLSRLGIPLPWILVLGVLALIFVFTAYAVRSSGGGTGGTKPDGVLQIGSCVTVATNGAAETGCDVPHDGRVVSFLPVGSACDDSSTGVLDRQSGHVVCVRRG
jgi:hypothetical protein